MSITFDKSTKTFYLDNGRVTYSFFVNEFGYLEHLYYGPQIGYDDIRFTRTVGGISGVATVPGCDASGFNSYHFYRPELAFYGSGDFREPTLQFEDFLGNKVVELLYESHEIVQEKRKIKGMPSSRGGESLIVTLRDKISGFAADLHYTLFSDCDVVARRIVYKNDTGAPLTLNRAYSFSFSLPKNDYDIITLYGSWARERQTERYRMHYGVSSIDSKRTASSATLNPFMAVVSHDATESSGDAYGFSLVYSSSFVLKCEGTNDGQTLVTGGISDFDFSYFIESNGCFETPEILIAYASDGIGGMSRTLHDCMREHIIPERWAKSLRPIVINNWEGTYFNFNTEKLKKMASAVANTGIDTFVLDDGWFGVRNSDSTGLGDWWVNEDKIKGGLDELISYVNSIGMDFGLWFEPEMVSEDSELFRKHPDYAIGIPGRPRSYSRHQFVLDITRADVRDYIVNSVNNILQKHNIKYVKWDYNRRVTESYSLCLPPHRQKEFAHRYALGLYDICERIICANPEVFFEGCAGGGARFDPAMLCYFPQIWTSDDTDANERVNIQYGTSLVYPLSSMSAHISAIPNHQTCRVTERSTRADIAHLGPTGYELDPSDCTKEERDLISCEIEAYKKMNKLLIEGDLYRIENPFESNYFGFMLVAKDKSEAHLTLYKRLGGIKHSNPIKRFYVQGLAPNKRYRINELGIILDGKTLINVGIPEMFDGGDFKTATYTFTEVHI